MYLRIALISLLLWCAGCTQDPAPAASSSSHAMPDPAGLALAGGGAMPVTPGRRHSFANLPDRGDLVAYPAQRVVRKDGAYTWHRAGLSEEHALRAVGGIMQFTTPAGAKLRFQYERHVEHPSGDWTWIGRAQGGAASDEVVLTFGEKAAFGTISQPGQAPLKLTMGGGVSWLIETDRSQIAGIDNPATRPRTPDYLIPPKITAGAGASAETTQAASTSTSALAAATTTVDVVLGYTGGFAAAQGGQSQAVTRLNNLVEISNEAYVNSQLDARVRLVHAMQVSYADNTSNESTLEALTGFRAPSTRTTPDPAFAALRSARDQYGADLVSLVRAFNSPENDGCGIAWLIGGGRTGIADSDEYFGYSVVSDGRDVGSDGKTYFCREETLAHELGHNMGSQHDRASATVDGNVNYGLYQYSFGYKTAAGAGNFYTVMAYGDTGQTSYRVFSNPRITICGGSPCGVADQSDNARSLDQAMGIVATFRPSVVSQPIVQRSQLDANADGKSDMFWHNPGTGELHYYLMSGTDITGGRGAYYMTPGYALRAISDYNGDGRADLLWSNGADVRMSLATASGTFSPAVTLLAYPPGWTLLGAGDANGDGKSDMFWHNPGTGELHYYLMNGTDITGGRGAYYMTPGHTVRAISDHNGDGRADLLWSNGVDVRMSLGTASGTFSPAVTLLAYPPGWTLVGAGDVNADGKSDMFWHNPGTGEVHYYLMNGTDITGGRGAHYMAQGHTVRAISDYNGDGRADLLWSNGVDVRMSLATWSGTFSPAVTLLAYPAGWSLVHGAAMTPKVFGDANADGKSDMFWHNPNTGEVHYYLMNGTDITSGRGAYYMTAGHTVRAISDYSGDGRADLLWSNGVDVRMSLATGSGTFSPAVTLLAYPAGWTLLGAADANADGKSDMFWHNPSTGEVHYYLMNGTDITGGRGAYYMTLGHTVRTIGDYNGDGRADLLWSNGVDVRMSLATGSGTFSPAVTLLAYPAGWTLLGAADANADGKSDMFWHNQNTGEVHYYLMNGTDITGGRGAYYMTPGHTVRAIGDHNGDGRADLLWSNGADVRMSLATGSGTFSPAVTLLAYPAGWSLASFPR